MVRGDAVELDRLALLHLVPHEHAIRNLVNQSLRCQVIPAADPKHGSDAQPACAADLVYLARTEIQQRRQHEYVGINAFEDLVDLGRRRERAIEYPEQTTQQPQYGDGAE